MHTVYARAEAIAEKNSGEVFTSPNGHAIVLNPLGTTVWYLDNEGTDWADTVKWSETEA